jgi:hypothetical protein
VEHPGIPANLESAVAGKNKGGREIRKPKQDKKPKIAATTSLIVPPAKAKRPPSR